MANSAKAKNPPAKMKKVRTAPTNTSLLPPCRVCGEPAAGFHYGANTCEACKGFFRRTLVRGRGYKCVSGDEKCNVLQVRLTYKKKICPQCRYLKCLAVGMSTDAIKTGRYTHAKRTQDILEYQQVMGVVDSNICSSETPSAVSSSITNTVPSSIESSLSSSLTVSVPSSNTTSVMEYAMSSASSSSESVSSGAVDSMPVRDHPTHFPVSVIPSPLSLEDCENSPQYTTLTPINLDGLDPHGTSVPIPMVHASMMSGSSDVPSSSAASLTFETDSADQPMAFAGGPNYNSLAVKDLNILTPLSCVSSPECLTLPTVGESTGGDLSDEECRILTGHLLQSHNLMDSCKFKLTAEEILQKQKMCYENCQAQREAFGPMGQVSEEEYQEVYQTTGIDVDGRQTFVTHLSKLLDENIRQYISFVKTIPGYSMLTMDDQIRLIKDNRCEASLIFQADAYNDDLKVMTLPPGRTFCHHQMEKFCGRERQEVRCRCLREVKKLGLSYSEKVLFKCLILFTVGQEDVDEPEKISLIQWKIAQCLLWQLKENKRPNPTRVFSRIISTFCLIKELAQIFHEWIKSEPFSHYAQFKNNKLLAEWFSSS